MYVMSVMYSNVTAQCPSFLSSRPFSFCSLSRSQPVYIRIGRILTPLTSEPLPAPLPVNLLLLLLECSDPSLHPSNHHHHHPPSSQPSHPACARLFLLNLTFPVLARCQPPPGVCFASLFSCRSKERLSRQVRTPPSPPLLTPPPPLHPSGARLCGHLHPTSGDLHHFPVCLDFVSPKP
ncbi:hypothetical protein LZ30DRAFT_702285 [Colletotrichum cereale]|nr:hypothetical protein LZ30DRAFT_702285 [Colletotrichum cereale]